MHTDLMQLFPMGITGLDATDHHDDSFFMGLAVQSPGNRLKSRRPRAGTPCEGKPLRLTEILSRGADRPRRIDLLIDYFGERRGPGSGLSALARPCWPRPSRPSPLAPPDSTRSRSDRSIRPRYYSEWPGADLRPVE
jgi:hypothetical protein